MHRIDTDGATVDHKFKDGPAPATVVDAAWLNGLQESFMQIFASAGITPVKGDFTKFLAALLTLFAERNGTIFTGGVGRDPHFYLDMAGGNPFMMWDVDMSIQGDRTARRFVITVNGTGSTVVDEGGVTVSAASSIKKDLAGKYLHWNVGLDGDSFSRTTSPPVGGADGDFVVQKTGTNTGKLWHNYGGTWLDLS